MTIYNYSNPILKNLLGEEMPKEQLEDKFLTPTKFSQEIEKLVKCSNGLITYIEAVVTYCQENDIEWGYDFVHDPIHLNISTLPSFIKEELIEKYSDNVVYNDIVKMLKSDNINAIIAFHKDIKKYDNLRSENFTDIYPEWSEIILYDM